MDRATKPADAGTSAAAPTNGAMPPAETLESLPSVLRSVLAALYEHDAAPLENRVCSNCSVITESGEAIHGRDGLLDHLARFDSGPSCGWANPRSASSSRTLRTEARSRRRRSPDRTACTPPPTLRSSSRRNAMRPPSSSIRLPDRGRCATSISPARRASRWTTTCSPSRRAARRTTTCAAS